MKLVVGLGNPGGKYAATRHNLGFAVLDEVARRLSVAVTREKFGAQMGETRFRGEKIVLLKPQTYMNRSGDAVSEALGFFKADIADLIVIHDDLDLEFGKLKVKVGGSDGGHKGIRSILSSVKDRQFARVRMGIGKPEYGEDVVDYVLRSFYPWQQRYVAEWVAIGADAVATLLGDGVVAATNSFNRKIWFEPIRE